MHNDINIFASSIIAGKGLISFDIGMRKIGVAISDASLIMALPQQYIERKGHYLDKLHALLINKAGIVVGWPLELDGTIGKSCAMVESFVINKIKTSLPILLQDERMTTKLANHKLKAFGINRKTRHALDDSISAQIILDEVLENLRKINGEN